MSNRSGDIIAETVRIHTFDPDAPPNSPVCMCGAEPLDSKEQHVSRMVQHAIANQSTPHLSDTKIKILGGDFTYEELQTLATSGVDAFDLLRVIVNQDIEAKDRAASNGAALAVRESMSQ